MATPPRAMQSSLGAQGGILSWSKAENTYIVMLTCHYSMPSNTYSPSPQIASIFFFWTLWEKIGINQLFNIFNISKIIQLPKLMKHIVTLQCGLPVKLENALEVSKSTLNIYS